MTSKLPTQRRLRIAHLYPELLNLYGDSGNMLVLAAAS
jgi:CobQ-like glutamine amidotransferase family enzyme